MPVKIRCNKILIFYENNIDWSVLERQINDVRRKCYVSDTASFIQGQDD